MAGFSNLTGVGCPEPSTYAASVTWADGSTSPASIGPASGDLLTCAYSVSAGHTFAEEGSEAITVTVTDAGGQATTATGTATVADALMSATGTGLTAVAGTPIGATVAHAYDADPSGVASLYRATVSWGDGTTTTDPTIAADPAGGFAVSAGHTYARTGIFSTATTITDPGGSSATATGTVSVSVGGPPPPPAGPPPPPPGPAAPGPTVPASAGSEASRPPVVGVSAPSLAGTRGFSLRLTCPTATPRCRGVARVITLPARAQRPPLRGGASVGSALFVLRSGESRTVTIPVAARLRRALRRARSARLAGVAIAFGAAGRNAAATGPSAMISTTRLG